MWLLSGRQFGQLEATIESWDYLPMIVTWNCASNVYSWAKRLACRYDEAQHDSNLSSDYQVAATGLHGELHVMQLCLGASKREVVSLIVYNIEGNDFTSWKCAVCISAFNIFLKNELCRTVCFRNGATVSSLPQESSNYSWETNFKFIEGFGLCKHGLLRC